MQQPEKCKSCLWDLTYKDHPIMGSSYHGCTCESEEVHASDMQYTDICPGYLNKEAHYAGNCS